MDSELEEGGFEPENILSEDFEKYFAPSQQTVSVVFKPQKAVEFDLVQMREYVALGQRVSGFTLEAKVEGQWTTIWGNGTTIGYKRVVRVPLTRTDEVRLSITASKAIPLLNGFGLFKEADLNSN